MTSNGNLGDGVNKCGVNLGSGDHDLENVRATTIIENDGGEQKQNQPLGGIKILKMYKFPGDAVFLGLVFDFIQSLLDFRY